MRIMTPFFYRHREELNLPSGATVEDCVMIFINILRGTDRLLAREDGHEKNIRLSLPVLTSLLKVWARGSQRAVSLSGRSLGKYIIISPV